MKLGKRLAEELKLALKSRDSGRAGALRLLLAALKNKEIEKQSELTDEEVMAVLKSEAKKRQEAEAIYSKAKRIDLAQKETAELKLIREFLPQPIDREQITQVVEELKKTNQLPANFGEAMRLVLGRFKGQADGREVAEIVKTAL